MNLVVWKAVIRLGDDPYLISAITKLLVINHLVFILFLTVFFSLTPVACLIIRWLIITHRSALMRSFSCEIVMHEYACMIVYAWALRYVWSTNMWMFLNIFFCLYPQAYLQTTIAGMFANHQFRKVVFFFTMSQRRGITFSETDDIVGKKRIKREHRKNKPCRRSACNEQIFPPLCYFSSCWCH